MIEAILERCAGIDVGKKFVVVCVMTGGARDEPHTQIKKFGTIVPCPFPSSGILFLEHSTAISLPAFS